MGTWFPCGEDARVPILIRGVLSCSGVDRRIIIWDLGSASQLCELKGHRDTVYQLAFSRDGTILASGGGDNCVKLWDASNFEEAAKSIDSSKW